jgi:hypothetical protein
MNAQSEPPLAPLAVSPCVNVCALDPGSGLCYGCLRTLDEISVWSRATNQERLDILAAVERRRAERPAWQG